MRDREKVCAQETDEMSNSNKPLKVPSAILIQYPFCQIQQIPPHGPLAVCSVCVREQIWCSYTALALLM